MRLELALMVGILFFCSWCAYIVARMNSSVASEPVEAPTTWRHSINQSEYPHSHPSNTTRSQLEQQQQQQRIYQASEPPIRYQAPTAIQQQLTSGWSQPQPQPQHQYQAPWQAYALPTNQEQLPATPTPDFGPAPELLDDAAAPPPPDYDTSSQVGEPEVGGDSEPAASDDNETEGDATAEGDDANTTDGGGDVDDETEAGDDDPLPVEGAPPTQTELDEVAQRRSFDEFQFDSNERDQNGQLVSTKRRHLVNGRPVATAAKWDGRRSGHLKPAAASTRRTNYATASAPHAGLKLGRAGATSRAAEVGARPSGEFERLVNEIDQEDKLNKRRQRHDDSTKPEESQQRDRVVVAAAAQLPKPPIKGDKRAVTQHPVVVAAASAAPLKSRIKPGSNSHEHRLSESLTQQQWDDDATTPSESSQIGNSDDDGEATTDDKEKSEQSDDNDEDDDQQVAKHDDEAQKLEGLAQDLMLDSKYAELTRRRRQVVSADEDEDDDDDDDDSQQSSGAVELVLGNDMRVLPGNSSRADKHGGRVIDHRGQDGELKADTATLNSTSVASATTPVPDHQATADNRPQVIRSEWGGNSTFASDPVSSLEDMHIEVLAQPPPLTNHSSPRPEVASSVAQQKQQQQQLGYFPRVASPFAAGSASKVSKRTKKYGKKKSKMEASKYKAASAYAKKHSSKQKKGQMRKKKRKSEKKLIAGKKHFAGSTGGYKKSRGRGLKGANKGATYLKDKGYKKRGFKKAYHKLETGDHKTYFDEFRDKDHKKKWKKYDDKHKYSQNKKWAGSDMKHMNHHDLKEARGKASKSAKWRAGHKSKWAKEANKYKKAKKMAQKSQVLKKKKKKKKKRTKEQ